MEYCSTCRRRFASYDVARRHSVKHKDEPDECLSASELNSRGIVLLDGVWHRPKVPRQLPLWGARNPWRPTKPKGSSALLRASDSAERGAPVAQDAGTRTGAEVGS